MKNLSSILAVLIMLGLAAPMSLAASDDNNIPRSWYVLPEDAEEGENLIQPEFNEYSILERENRFANSLGHILNVNHRAFDNADDLMESSLTERRGERKWKLTNLKLSLGMTASGAMGVFFAKGAIGTELFFRRVAEESDFQEVASTEVSEQVHLTLNESTTNEQITTQLEPVIDGLIASGRVKNEANLRHNLYEKALEFKGMMQGIGPEEWEQWDVTKIRLELSISLSGSVAPGIVLGGGVRLRFDWVPNGNSGGGGAPGGIAGKHLKELLSAIGDALAELDQERFAQHGYEFKGYSVALGLFGKVNFGVVKGGIGGTMIAFLKKRTVPLELARPAEHRYAAIKMIDNKPKRRHISYARRNNINYEITKGNSRRPRQIIYDITAKAFKVGMAFSSGISERILAVASRRQGKKWEPYLIKPSFALSIGGTAGVVTLGAKGGVKMAFKKIADQ